MNHLRHIQLWILTFTIGLLIAPAVQSETRPGKVESVCGSVLTRFLRSLSLSSPRVWFAENNPSKMLTIGDPAGGAGRMPNWQVSVNLHDFKKNGEITGSRETFELLTLDSSATLKKPRWLVALLRQNPGTSAFIVAGISGAEILATHILLASTDGSNSYKSFAPQIRLFPITPQNKSKTTPPRAQIYLDPKKTAPN